MKNEILKLKAEIIELRREINFLKDKIHAASRASVARDILVLDEIKKSKKN